MEPPICVRCAALFAACVLPNIVVSQPDTSFLLGGSFERGIGDRPAYWSLSLYPTQKDPGSCLSRSQERVRWGEWSLKIDTGDILGEETTLVFNGAVSADAARVSGGRLEVCGYVYVEPGTAVRPIGMRLRCSGPDESGQTAFLGDVVGLTVLGRPGEWVEFRASGALPKGRITGMDLHCSIRPDVVRTVQFLDDLVVRVPPCPDLELRLPRPSMWRDEGMIAVEVVTAEPSAEPCSLVFTLHATDGRVIAKWERQKSQGLFGLELPRRLLPEGTYRLRVERRTGGAPAAQAEALLELASSPWEGAPQRLPGGPQVSAVVECFSAMGTVAPTELMDTIEREPELVSPDLSLGACEKQGYVAFTRHPFDPVPTKGRPRPGELGSIRVFAARGQYVTATLSVSALRDQAYLSVGVEDLKGEKATISRDCLDVRLVRQIQSLPAFLESRSSVPIAEGQTRTFWITCYVPPEARPGFYRGAVSVRSEDGSSSAIPLLLRVLPFELPPATKGYGFWWKMDGRWTGYYSQEREVALEQIRKQFILLREHGCNMVSWYGMPRMTSGPGGAIELDFEQDHWGHDRFSPADFFRLGRETHFLSPNHPIQYPGAESLHSDWVARAVKLDRGSPEFDRFYEDICRRVNDWVAKQGYQLAFACVDEIGNSQERREEALRFYKVATQAGVLTSVTDNSMHGGVHLMGQPRFDQIIKMRLYNFITAEMIEHCRQSDDRLWLYNLASAGWSAQHDRLVFGLFTERCGAEGCAQWAFQWPSGNKDPYAAVAAGERPGWHYALPAPDGPLPTLALVGVREGIDDARYLALLASRTSCESQEFLDDVPVLSVSIHGFLKDHSPNWFDVQRWRMARHVMAKG